MKLILCICDQHEGFVRWIQRGERDEGYPRALCQEHLTRLAVDDEVAAVFELNLACRTGQRDSFGVIEQERRARNAVAPIDEQEALAPHRRREPERLQQPRIDHVS